MGRGLQEIPCVEELRSHVTVSLHHITHFSHLRTLLLSFLPFIPSFIPSFFHLHLSTRKVLFRCPAGTTHCKQQGAQGGMRQGPALCHFTITLVGLWPPLFPPSPLQTCTKLVPAQCLPKGGAVGRTCRVWTTRLLQTTYSLAHPKTSVHT